MRNSTFLILLISFSGIKICLGQQEKTTTIKLNNPSFEDIRRNSHVPTGWYDCGFIGQTAPDVQPGSFGVTQKPKNGMSYLGLVVRDNETWEAVAQRLTQPLENGNCYSLSISLCRSELYLSPSQTSSVETNYLTPVKLRIWGGNNFCQKQILLGESPLIKNYRWIEFPFKLEAKGDAEQYTHIILEAYYQQPTLFPYNGNILLDNASEITLIPCDENQPIEEPIVQVDEPDPQPVQLVEPPLQKDPPLTINDPIQPKNNPSNLLPAANEEEPSLEGFTKSELKKGQIIRMDKLFFEADKAEIKSNSNETLEKVFVFLAKNTDISIEIGGHTNDTPPDWYCDSLSTLRAKAVADYLSDKGIEKDRLQFKGYGKRKPLHSNRTADGRRKNQRVEIKVLDIESRQD